MGHCVNKKSAKAGLSAKIRMRARPGSVQNQVALIYRKMILQVGENFKGVGGYFEGLGGKKLGKEV